MRIAESIIISRNDPPTGQAPKKRLGPGPEIPYPGWTRRDPLHPTRLSTPSLPRGGTPDLTHLPTVGVGDVLSTPAAPVIEPYHAAAVYASNLFTPWDANDGDLRMIGLESCIPNEAKVAKGSVNLTIFNGTTGADGSVAFLLRGDTFQTVTLPATISAAHAITWSGGFSYNTYGSYTSNYNHRPVLTYAIVRVIESDVDHSVDACSYRIFPGTVANQLAACPTVTNAGVDPTLSRTSGAHQEILHPRGPMLYPVTNRLSRTSTDREFYNQVTIDRTVYALTGTVVWLYGLRSTDRVELCFMSAAEYLGSTATGPLYPNLLAVVGSNGAAHDLQLAASDAATDAGLDAVAVANTDELRGIGAKVAKRVWSEKAADTLDNSIEAITSLVSGRFGDAARSVYRAVVPWFRANPYYAPFQIKMVDGTVVRYPPYLQHLANLARAQRAATSDAKESKEDTRESKEDFDVIPRRECVPTPRPLAGRALVMADDEPAPKSRK